MWFWVNNPAHFWNATAFPFNQARKDTFFSCSSLSPNPLHIRSSNLYSTLSCVLSKSCLKRFFGQPSNKSENSGKTVLHSCLQAINICSDDLTNSYPVSWSVKFKEDKATSGLGTQALLAFAISDMETDHTANDSNDPSLDWNMVLFLHPPKIIKINVGVWFLLTMWPFIVLWQSKENLKWEYMLHHRDNIKRPRS